jgi:hypothetical protein
MPVVLRLPNNGASTPHRRTVQDGLCQYGNVPDAGPADVDAAAATAREYLEVKAMNGLVP